MRVTVDSSTAVTRLLFNRPHHHLCCPALGTTGAAGAFIPSGRKMTDERSAIIPSGRKIVGEKSRAKNRGRKIVDGKSRNQNRAQ
jgi:hypothetical protein